jgi:hypothetical protein
MIPALPSFDAAVASDYRNDVVITTELDQVVMRVLELEIRVFWTPANARKVAAALVRMANRIEQFGEPETNG